MATANRKKWQSRSKWPMVLVALAVLIGALFWLNRATINGYTATGAALGAKSACSCRYLAGRSLNDCRKDFEPGMGIVLLSENKSAQSITAYVPLLASETARYDAGSGCILGPWQP